MNLTIDELRSMGFKVRVMHQRKVDQWGLVKPRGGQTTVELVTPDGTVLVGKAKCSKKDGFNKRLGVSIALGRALTRGCVVDELVE